MPEPRRRRPSPPPGDGLPTRPVRLFQAQRHPRSPDPDALPTRPYARAELLRPPASREPPTRFEHPRTLPRAPAPAASRTRLRRSWRAWTAGTCAGLLLIGAGFALYTRRPQLGVSGSAGPAAPALPHAAALLIEAGRPAQAGEGALAPPPLAPQTSAALREPQPAEASPPPATAPDVRPAAAAAMSARGAAEQLAQGRYPEARAAYRELARARPEQRVYATLAALIERRLAERCRQRLEAGGTPCTEQDP